MDIEEDRMRAVQDAVWQLLSPRNALAGVPELDVSKPNFHDNKVEFSRELEAVETAIEALRIASRALYPEDLDTDLGRCVVGPTHRRGRRSGRPAKDKVRRSDYSRGPR